MSYPCEPDYEQVMLRFPKWVKKNEKQKWFKDNFRTGFPHISYNQFSFRIKDYILGATLNCGLPYQVWETKEAKEHILNPLQKKLENEFSTIEDTLENLGKLKDADDTLFWDKKYDNEDYKYFVIYGTDGQTKRLIKSYNNRMHLRSNCNKDSCKRCSNDCELHSNISYAGRRGDLPYIRGNSVKEAIENTYEIFSKLQDVSTKLKLKDVPPNEALMY